MATCDHGSKSKGDLAVHAVGDGLVGLERVRVAMGCTDGVLMGSGGKEGVSWHSAGGTVA